MSSTKNYLISFMCAICFAPLSVRANLTLTCGNLFGSAYTQSQSLWPKSGIYIPKRKVELESSGPSEFKYKIDNTVYDQKILNFLDTGLTVYQWERLPLKQRSTIDRLGNQSGLAVMGSFLPQFLSFSAKANEVLTLVFESPQSDRAQFDIFNSGHYKSFMFAPREFKFVRAKVQNDGRIVGLADGSELVGTKSANQGRIQAVLRSGDQVQIVFESPDTISNRELYKSLYWLESAGTYSPHVTGLRTQIQFSGIVTASGDIVKSDDPTISVQKMIDSGRPIEKIFVRDQQSE